MAISAGTAFITLLADMSKFATSVNAGLTKNQAVLQKTGKAMSKFITLPIIAAGVAAVKLASDFEAQMDRIVGLAGQSREQVAEWSDELLELGPALGKGPRELGKALYFVASSGVPVEKAMDVVTVSAKAATAGLGDTEVVADAVTSAMNAYATSNLSASEATDILTQAVKLGKGEASAIAPVLGSILPTSSELGVSFQDVAAALAAMTTTGDTAALAATKVNAIMSALLKVTPQSAEAFASVGLNAEDLRASLGEEGLLPTLQQVKDAVGENVEVLAAMFPNVRALRGVLALTGNNAENVARIFGEMANSAGATDEAFKAVSESAEFKFNQALAQLEVTAIKIGSVILPAVTSAVTTLGKAFEFVGDLSPGMQKFIAQVLGIVAVIGPLLIVLSKIPKIVKAVQVAFASLTAHPWVLATAAAIITVQGLIEKFDQLKNAGQVWDTEAGRIASEVVKLASSTDSTGRVLRYFNDQMAQTARITNDATGAVLEQEQAIRRTEQRQLFAESNQAIAQAFRDQVVSVSQAISAFRGIGLTGEETAARLVQLADTVDSTDIDGLVRDFNAANISLVPFKHELTSLIQDLASKGLITLEEFQHNLRLVGVSEQRITQLTHAYANSFADSVHDVNTAGKAIKFFAGKSEEEMKEFASGIEDSVEVAIGDFKKMGEAFKTTPAQLARSASEAVKIARQMHADLKTIFKSKELSEAQKEALASLPADQRRAWVEAGAAARQQIAKDATTLAALNRRNAAQITNDFGNVLRAGGRSAGAELPRGAAEGVSATASVAIARARQLGLDMAAATRAALEVKSPSEVMKRVGVAFVQGLSKGIERELNSLQTSIDKMVEIVLAEEKLSDANEAIIEGIRKTYELTRREMGKYLTNIGKDLDRLSEKMTSFSDAIKSGFGGAGDLISGAMDAIQTAADQTTALREEGIADITITPDLLDFAAGQISQAKNFAQKLSEVAAAGLAPALLSELASQGQSALPLIEGLLAGGEDMIKAFNNAHKTIQNFAQKTAKELTDAQFGARLDKLGRKFIELGENLEIATRQFQRAITELFHKLGIKVPHFAEGGIVTRPTLGILGERGPERITPLSRRGGEPVVVNVTVEGNAIYAQDLAREIRDVLLKDRRYKGTLGLT